FLNPAFEDSVDRLSTGFKILSNAGDAKPFCMQSYHSQPAFSRVVNFGIGGIASAGSLGRRVLCQNRLHRMMRWLASVSNKTYIGNFSQMKKGKLGLEFDHGLPYG